MPVSVVRHMDTAVVHVHSQVLRARCVGDVQYDAMCVEGADVDRHAEAATCYR